MRAEALEGRRLLSVTVADVNAGPASRPEAARDFAGVGGGGVVFVADDGVHGMELFRADGSAGAGAGAGALLVRDINPVAGVGSSAAGLTNVNGTVYFSANDGVHGAELWKTDGTAAGTVMVKDLVAGAAGAGPKGFVAGPGGLAYFVTGTGATSVLWKTDGTEAGTGAVHAFTSVAGGPIVVPMGGALYYLAQRGTGWTDVWACEGGAPRWVTAVEQSGVSDVLVAEGGGSLVFSFNSSDQVWRFTPAGGLSMLGQFAGNVDLVAGAGPTVFFTVNEGAWPSGLWAWGGAGGSSPRKLTGVRQDRYAAVGDRLFFRSGETELWSSDGTTAGTGPVAGFGSAPGAALAAPTEMYGVGDRLYYDVLDGPSKQWVAYRSDGTAAGTERLGSFARANGWRGARLVGGRVYFAADDGVTGLEAWSTDGTAGGTRVVADLFGGTLGSTPLVVGSLKGRTYFFADDGVNGSALWSTDGTAGGAKVFASIAAPSENPVWYREDYAGVATSQYLYFLARGGPAAANALWRTDGTVEGTIPVTAQGVGRSWGVIGDRVYFTTGPAIERGLWTSDGTPEGTVPVPGGQAIGQIMTVMDGVMYCSGYDAANGLELWRSDGTEAGTYRLTDINPGGADSISSSARVVGDAVLFFVADGRDAQGLNVYSLYAYSAGAGVSLVKRSGGADGVSLSAVGIGTGGKYFFPASTGAAGKELWVSDGTAAGTRAVADLYAGAPGSSPRDFFVAGDGVVAFRATTAAGERLFRSDGTAAGTYALGDVLPESRGGAVRTAAHGGFTYFGGTRGGLPSLWRTDGTVAGTTMVSDVPLGSHQFAVAGGAVYFTGSDAATGHEVWRFAEDGPPLTGAASTEFAPTAGVTFHFGRALADAPARVAWDLRRVLADGSAVAVSEDEVAVSVDAAAGAVRFAFPRFANGVLPDGNYRMTLPAGFVRDEAGNPLGRDVVYEFYVLSGDANGDRRVDFGDLVVLAQNYGASGRGWAGGDFTGDGVAGFADLVVLAQRYGVTLPAGGGVTGAAGAMPALASVMAGSTAPAATPVGGAGLDDEETGARAAYRPAAAVRAAPTRAAFGRVRVGGGEVSR